MNRRTSTARGARLVLAGVAALLAISLAACGSPGKAAASASAPTTKVIDVTVAGQTITPNGKRVDVTVGQPVELDVKADAAGELHVHSTPEQHLEYKPGTTIFKLGPFKVAGIIEIESHALGLTVVQLEVR